jgi:hypothetical protein
MFQHSEFSCCFYFRVKVKASVVRLVHAVHLHNSSNHLTVAAFFFFDFVPTPEDFLNRELRTSRRMETKDKL